MTAVLLAASPPVEAALAAALAREAGLTVARRCADLAEVLGAAEAGLGDVAVVAARPELDRALVQRFAGAGCRVVALVDDAAEAERLANCDVAAAVPSADSDGVVGAVRRAAESSPETTPVLPESDPVAARSAADGKLVAVWGPHGAPGRTTVAVSLAAEAARLGQTAVVVDADSYGGAIGTLLGLIDDAPGIAALARAGRQGTLTQRHLNKHVLEVEPRMGAVTGITRAARWSELSRAALEPVWAALRADWDLVVVDCGPGIDGGAGARGSSRDEATLAALEAADAVVAVCGSDPVSVQRFASAAADFSEFAWGAAPRVTVVNRVRASVAGPSPAHAVADALARYASVDEVWPVPDDPRACDGAMLAGETLAEHAPRSSVRRALVGVAKRVLAVVDGATPAPVAENAPALAARA